MLYKQTPPIQYIPIFESAARHLSFKKAAEELCVTAPAVSQQIKAFEQWLGKPLFERHTRLLSLTDEGNYYFKVAQEVMKTHQKGFTEYTRRFNRTSLHVSAPFYVAQELVMPNYLQFNEYSPGTELRIEARMTYVDFDSETIDAAIRFGDGNWPDLDCLPLLNAFAVPVCSQSYADEHEFTDLSELYKHRLIYADPTMNEWGQYFWGSDVNHDYDKIICDSYLAALNAAVNGLGVALAILPTANSWINDGRLVLPFPIKINTNRKYWLVYPKDSHRKKELDGLYRWLQKIFSELPTLNTPLTTLDVL